MKTVTINTAKSGKVLTSTGADAGAAEACNAASKTATMTEKRKAIAIVDKEISLIYKVELIFQCLASKDLCGLNVLLLEKSGS